MVKPEQEMVKPLEFDEEWRIMETHDKTRCAIREVNWGKSKDFPVWSPLGVPQSSQIDAPFQTHTGRASLP